MTSNGKVAIISGGSRGLGKAFVTGLLDAGYNVATYSRKPTEFIENLERTLPTERFFYRAADASSSEQLRQFVDEVVSRFGRVDVLVNNAGIARDGLLAMASEEAMDEVIDVNLRATLKLTKYCVRKMLTQRSGRIINISSIIGLNGYRGLSVYSATKAALDATSRSLARELGPRGILVNSIAPGYLRTEMTHGIDGSQIDQIVRRTPLGRLGEPGDVLPLLLFLCSDGANFITGQTFVIDGGITV